MYLTPVLRHSLVQPYERWTAEGKIVNERGALIESKRILEAYFQQGDAIDASVRRKIGSLSRKVPSGSPEWDVLYRKYFEEETRKRKF